MVTGCGDSGARVVHQTRSSVRLAPPVIKEVFTPLPCPKGRAARGTTLGLEGCAEQTTLRTDAQINASAGAIFRLIGDASARRNFLAGEKAWLAYRQAGCKSVADVYRGGSAQPVAFGACVVSRNTQHLKELAAFEGFLKQIHGKQSPTRVRAGSGPPSSLSGAGRVLWQFEALLHDTFGNGNVCSAGRSLNFTDGDCSPLAVYSPYFYVFAQARHSAFHISSKKKVGGFGNYAQPVLIRGRSIACNARETRFLIEFPDAVGFTVDCSRAGYVIG